MRKDGTFQTEESENEHLSWTGGTSRWVSEDEGVVEKSRPPGEIGL